MMCFSDVKCSFSLHVKCKRFSVFIDQKFRPICRLCISKVRGKSSKLSDCVNWFTDIGAECGDVRPLDETRLRKLTINGVQLLDHIVIDVAFLTELATAGCITWPQREHLMNIVQPRDRNDNLLEFLTRRSVADFQKFVDILSKEHAHLVPVLVMDGGNIYLMCLSVNFTAA